MRVGKYFKHCISMHWQSHLYSHAFSKIQTIIPIPLHPQKHKKRGFNQAEYLAQEISTLLNIPVNTTTLTVDSTQPYEEQKYKTKEEREQTKDTTFMISNHLPKHITHVLLVDDISTTGSTLNIAKKALKKHHKGLKVECFSLAQAD